MRSRVSSSRWARFFSWYFPRFMREFYNSPTRLSSTP
jgi:hypothetical protein